MKERRVTLAPEAEEDLTRMYEWVAQAASPATAMGYVERIESFCLGLRFAAERGQARNDIRPGLRIVGFERRVTIAFVVSETQVTVLRLFYGGRAWEALLTD